MAKSSSTKGQFVKFDKGRLDTITKILDIDWKEAVEHGFQLTAGEFLQFMSRLYLNSEVLELVGERNSRGRLVGRWGSQAGSVVLLDQKVPIEKPRVRTKGPGSAEVELESYQNLNDGDFLNTQAAARLLAGVSTRNTEKTLIELLNGRGAGRQSISARGVKEMARQLETFKNRKLEKTDIVAIFIDGVCLADRTFVTALGLDKTGKKIVLGFEHGSTENSGVCRKLLSSLIDREILNENGGYLFIIDGGKGLRKAISEVFGKGVAVQRCSEHKRRNVLDQLPKKEHRKFNQKYSAALWQDSHKKAQNAFQRLIRELDLKGYKHAAASLLEGNTELLTVHRLGVEGALRRSLLSTNCIESMFSTARYLTRNVKRWQGEEQMERWLAASLLGAEKTMRRVPGYTLMPKLIAALRPDGSVKANRKS
jgi:putative transposase